MILSINPDTIQGLTKYEADAFKDLLNVYEAHRGSNEVKDRYYEGKISLNSVNLGIALPKGMQGLEIGCAWGAKCVDVLAARSKFDGFVGMNGETVDEIDELVQNNRMIAEYMKACKDELEFGSTFCTLSPDSEIKCKIRFHSPRMAAACWDGKKGRIAYGMAIIDTAPDNSKESTWIPSVINLYLDYAVIVFQRDRYTWKFNRVPHNLGRPLMEPMIWNATSSKPFGRSRIK